MRLFLYLASLIAGVYAIRFLLYLLVFRAFSSFWIPAGTLTPLRIAVSYTVAYLPFAFLGMRAFIWFKQGRIAAPGAFRGLPYVVAAVAAALVVLMIAGYVVTAIAAPSAGTSGVPLAFLLMLCGAFLALSMPVVEIKDWLEFFRERRRSSSHQSA